MDHRGYLAVAVSQSGRTPEITDVMTRLRAQGARTIVITNDPSSPLAESADLLVDLRAGEERAVPATKTCIAQLAAIAVMAEALGDVPWSSADLGNPPDLAANVLVDDGAPIKAAEALAATERLITLARCGLPATPTALC